MNIDENPINTTQFDEICEGILGRAAAGAMLAGSLLTSPQTAEAGHRHAPTHQSVIRKKMVEAPVNLEKLSRAISNWETRGIPEERKDEAVGDNGKALGRYQAHKEAVMDVNERFHTNYTHEDMKDPAKAKDVFIKYLQRWGNYYSKKYNKAPTYEVLARMWNGGGPSGFKKSATLAYWQGVKDRL
jgi:hypothetical protein